MTTRFNLKEKNGSSLQSGYAKDFLSDVTIPPVGIEDVDKSIFKLFNKEIPFQTSGFNEEHKKVPVLFAGAEKWALIKKNRAIKDRSGSLILPLITIGRVSTNQSKEDITGRGINQKVGEIIIRKKLDESDRGYQGLLNKIFLDNQGNIAAKSDNFGLTTLNSIGNNFDDISVNEGSVFHGDKKRNIYETLVVPTPQFISLNYEAIVWTQYTHHMNQIMECIYSSFLPQVQGWKIETDSGYWFVAQVEENSFESENNFDDLSQGERLIKTKFKIKVNAYILASSAPGVPIAVKRYVSAPDISFDVGYALNENNVLNENIVDDPFLGVDDPTLPLSTRNNGREDQRDTGGNPLFKQNDPALLAFKRGRMPNKYLKLKFKNEKGQEKFKYSRVSSVNKFTGETVFSPNSDIGGLIDTKVYDGFPWEKSLIEPSFFFNSPQFLNGIANAIATDENENYYIGGSFDSVLSNGIIYPIQRLVKISKTGQVYSNFNPNFADRLISAMSLHSSGLFVNRASGTSNGISRINLTTGATEWSVEMTSFSFPTNLGIRRVFSMHISEDFLYVGGNFSHVESFPINHICRFSLASGIPVLDTNWNTNVSMDNVIEPGTPLINCIRSFENNVYFSGRFNTFNNGAYTIRHIARVNASTGAVDPTWNVNPNASISGGFVGIEVFLVDEESRTMYIGGNFVQIGSFSNKNLAKIDIDTALPDTNWTCEIEKKPPPFSANVGPTKSFFLDKENSLLYVGGSFIGAYVNKKFFKRRAILRFNSKVAAIDGWNPEFFDFNETSTSLSPYVGSDSNDEFIKIPNRDFLIAIGEFDGARRNVISAGEDFAILDISL